MTQDGPKEPSLMISFIIPAWNEEQLIGRTIEAVSEAATTCGVAHEIIVVNDGSTDRTSEIAESLGAHVVNVAFRQISATRNAGAAVAQGDLYVFVDADTVITREAVRQTIEALRRGAVAGGALIRFGGPVPLWARAILFGLLLPLYRVAKLVGGCYIFATPEAFEGAGGFDETLFGGEEVMLAQRLKKHGRFWVIRERVITSGRKLRAYRFGELMGPVFSAVIHGKGLARSREGMDLWYGERREDPLAMGDRIERE